MAPCYPESSLPVRLSVPTAVPPRWAWLGFALYAAMLVGYHLVESNLWSLVRTGVGGLGFVPLNAGAIYWLWRASTNPAHGPGERRGLWWLAVMFG